MIKYFSALVALIVVGWGSYTFINKDLYPVALVNWRPVTAREWSRVFTPTIAYYQTLKKPEVSDQVFKEEMRRAVLDKLIEQRLIYQRINQADIETQISTLLAQNQNLKAGSEKLYNMSWANFQELVLRPQVALELMGKQLADNNQKIEDWLKQQKTAATVFVFARGFSWNG